MTNDLNKTFINCRTKHVKQSKHLTNTYKMYQALNTAISDSRHYMTPNPLLSHKPSCRHPNHPHHHNNHCSYRLDSDLPYSANTDHLPPPGKPDWERNPTTWLGALMPWAGTICTLVVVGCKYRHGCVVHNDIVLCVCHCAYRLWITLGNRLSLEFTECV